MADVLSPSRPLGNGMKVFRRMTLRERGHLSNHPTLWPVAEVCIGDDSIILKQGFVFGRPREYRCSWSEISEAVIHVRKRWKAYGKAGGWITQRLLRGGSRST